METSTGKWPYVWKLTIICRLGKCAVEIEVIEIRRINVTRF